MQADHINGLMRKTLPRACTTTARATCLLLAAAAVTIAGPGPATASEDQSDWTVAEVLGNVRHSQQAGVWWSARSGDALPAGSVVVTGDDGYLTVTREGDRIDVSPSSEFAVGERSADEGDGIMQRLGRMLFDMETRESRNFKVETPYLAAAIKGTIFAVTVTDDTATVDVEEGLVEVSHSPSGERAMLAAGGTASAGLRFKGLDTRSDSRSQGRTPGRAVGGETPAADDVSPSAPATEKGAKTPKGPKSSDKTEDGATGGGASAGDGGGQDAGGTDGSGSGGKGGKGGKGKGKAGGKQGLDDGSGTLSRVVYSRRSIS